MDQEDTGKAGLRILFVVAFHNIVDTVVVTVALLIYLASGVSTVRSVTASDVPREIETCRRD